VVKRKGPRKEDKQWVRDEEEEGERGRERRREGGKRTADPRRGGGGRKRKMEKDRRMEANSGFGTRSRTARVGPASAGRGQQTGREDRRKEK
jgi:hypothetical protein